MTGALDAAAMGMTGDLAVQQATLGRLRGVTRNMAQIDKASKDFEGMFMTQMLQPMFEGIGTNSLFGGGHGEEVMRSLLIQEYGKVASKRGGLGIADAVKREMIRMQNVAQGRPANAPLSDATPSSRPLTGGNYDAAH